MSYYRELKDFILELKGDVLFLSPRERWFLKILEEQGYPLEVVKSGIRDFYRAIRPQRRSTTPLFLAFTFIEKRHKEYLRRRSVQVNLNWQERFREIIQRLKDHVKEPIQEPDSPESAERVLKELEKRIIKELWDGLPQEEKGKILKKYAQFKDNEEFLKLLIKAELLQRFNLPRMSVFIY